MRRRVAMLAMLALLGGLVPLAGVPVATAQDGPPLPLPEPKVVPIHVTGPPEERMNIAILGDGYQWDQQSIFYEDVDRNLAVLFATEPYKSYRDYLNIYAVEIASIDYGVRCDPDGRVRHPDGTIRDTGEREGPINTKMTMLKLIFSHPASNPCADPLARGTVYTTAPPGCANFAEYYPPGVNPCESGNAARTRILNNYVAPVLGIPSNAQNLQTLAIFNTFTYGGIGGFHATTSGGSPQGPWISLHELGHSHGQLIDEYPYSSRDVVQPCRTAGEPTGRNAIQHTNYTSTEQMIADEWKWWRWIGEESLSGGEVGLYEGGMFFPCGVRRPSEHSMMRWIGFYFDQIGLEHMVGRITGLRDDGQMPLPSRPVGTVGSDEVLWVKPLQPRSHALKVTWRVGGADGDVVDTGNAPFLDLGELNLAPGTVVRVEVRDPVGPEGIDWVRDPRAGTHWSETGYNSPRFVQTREWTVGSAPVSPAPAGAEITNATLSTTPVSGTDWVFVEPNYPPDRVIDVSWHLNGQEIPNPDNLRNLDVGALSMPPGTFTLTATATDPAGGSSDTREWVVDNALPTVPRTLTESLTELDGDLEHPVYFGGWDMWLDPQDDRTGYDEERFVAGELRLNEDGWFGYYGFPEEPMPESPFRFRHSGTNVKALTYGNLGSGGLSKATFEQFFDGHPSGTFEPGYGTHLVEHRAIDAAGNIGDAEAYRATVLPGASPACTRTVSGLRPGRLNVTSGVTCLAADAAIAGGVSVRNGASLVAADGATIHGGLTADGAGVVHLFGARVDGDTSISGVSDLILVGSRFNGNLSLSGNQSPDVTILSGATRNYGVLVIGNQVTEDLVCTGNSPHVENFDVPNVVSGSRSGDCADA